MRTWYGLGAIVLAVAASGCIERKLQLTSDPPGATVWVSGVEVGTTPVTTPFTWHGEYEIIVRHEGYDTVKAARNVPPRIYEVPPLDLLSALAPWTYHDTRHFHFTMNKLDLPDDAELIDSARRMRSETLKPVESK
ncbi:MAG: PEGA domain-containing protein [Phycisphaerae bacterium]|nr:PEGA domain-containing protein [Phycisphaerae bacterium]